MTHKGTQTLTTEHLTLRRFTTDDARAMYENWAGDEKTTSFTLWKKHENVEESRGILESWVPQYEKDDYYHWAIVFEGEPVGAICLFPRGEWGRFEAGYAMGSRWWNRGVMTETLRAVRDYAFGELGAKRLYAMHDVKNVGSGRVMEKSGLKPEGVLRGDMRMKDGTIADMRVCGMVDGDWPARREVEAFMALPCAFEDFVEPGEPSDGEVSLVCVKKSPADPARKYVPMYSFEIRYRGERAGKINLRVGYPEGLYYGGNIGYDVDEQYRGRGVAGRACKLLAPTMRAHGMTHAYIANERDNLASKRVCEKLGATLLRVAELPEWTELYREGQRHVNVFDWEERAW